MPLTVAELMEKMPGAFLPEKAQGWMPPSSSNSRARKPGNGSPRSRMERSMFARHASLPQDDPDRRLADYVKIFTGELDGMQAFMQGKIKLAGDLNLAMKLMQMFKIYRLGEKRIGHPKSGI
jgi:hypothetical protein